MSFLKLCGFVCLLLSLSLLSCSRAPETPFAHERPCRDEFMIMSYNLRVYAYIDRDDDGQADDFKPESEIAPLIATVQGTRPAILCIQEIGSSDELLDLKGRLRQRGLDYPHMDFLGSEGKFANLAILSKFPVTSSDPVTNLSFTIKGDQYPVSRGFQQVDIAIHPALTLTVVNVHLKSKRYHRSGQTEMRRNESRLLAAHLRRIIQSDPERGVIVCGDFNDSVQSAAMREILDDEKTGVEDLVLTDAHGQVWTHFYSTEQTYSRIDYLLVNKPMKQRWVKDKSGIVQSQLTRSASDHRPIYATFSQQSRLPDTHEADSNAGR